MKKRFVVETVFDDVYFFFGTMEGANVCADRLNRFFRDYEDFLGNKELIKELPVAFAKKNPYYKPSPNDTVPF